jgi:hypothetical protein
MKTSEELVLKQLDRHVEAAKELYKSTMQALTVLVVLNGAVATIVSDTIVRSMDKRKEGTTNIEFRYFDWASVVLRATIAAGDFCAAAAFFGTIRELHRLTVEAQPLQRHLSTFAPYGVDLTASPIPYTAYRGAHVVVGLVCLVMGLVWASFAIWHMEHYLL